MNFNDVIKNAVIESFNTDISTTQICISLGIALLLGLFVFIVYRVAANDEFYSKAFNVSVTLVTVVTCGIVLAIQSNLVIGLGMVGALSIIRFRTAIKSPMDLLFMYWAVGVGIICGAGLFELAIILCIVVSIALFVLERFRSPASLGLVDIQCTSSDDFEGVLADLDEVTTLLRVRNRMSSERGAELVVEYKTKDEIALQRALSDKEAVLRYSILSADRRNR